MTLPAYGQPIVRMDNIPIGNLNIAGQAQGDLIRYDAVAGQWDRLPVGANFQVLHVAAGLPAWTAVITGITLALLVAITGTPTAAGAIWADLGAVTTIDINGGSIDGAAIGAASAAAGTFAAIVGTGLTLTSEVIQTAGAWAFQKAYTISTTAGDLTLSPTGNLILPKTIQIQDTSADHQYILAVSELAADRTVTLPLLAGNDEFVFKNFTQTLTNKTLTAPIITAPLIINPGVNQPYHFIEMTAGALVNTLGLQGQTSGQVTVLELFTKDGDGTDGLNIRLWAIGSPADITNHEYIHLAYNPAVPDFRLESIGGGTGTKRAIRALLGPGYIELDERAAPGAGAANTARIYAVVDGGALTDLAAVFQDGTVDIFAQEVTKPGDAVVAAPHATPGVVTIRRPHPGLVQLVAAVPGYGDWVVSEKEFHDAEKLTWVKGEAAPLPTDWVVETAAERAARVEAEAEEKVAPLDAIR